MNGEPPTVSDEVMGATVGFQELIKDYDFRTALDALSADVMQLADRFLRLHARQILEHCPDVEPEFIVSAVVGWILGMPAGRMKAEGRADAAFQHNALAAFVSAWSAENSARVYQPDRH